MQHVFTSNCLETSMITRDVTGELKVILILAVEQSMVSFWDLQERNEKIPFLSDCHIGYTIKNIIM